MSYDVWFSSGRSWDCDQRRPATPCCGGASWGVLKEDFNEQYAVRWRIVALPQDRCYWMNWYWTALLFFVHRFFLCIFFFRFSCCGSGGSAAKFLHFFKSLLFCRLSLLTHPDKNAHEEAAPAGFSVFNRCLRSCDCGVTMICYVHICSHRQPPLSIWDCSPLCFLQNASGLSQALGQYEATFGVRPLKVHTGVVDLLAISYWRGTLQSWSAIFEMGKARVHATWVFLWDLHYLF